MFEVTMFLISVLALIIYLIAWRPRSKMPFSNDAWGKSLRNMDKAQDMLWRRMASQTDALNSVATKKPRFPVGTQIVCPQCGKHIATAKRDIYRREAISSLSWDGIPVCSEMRCPECATYYAKSDGMSNYLHTAEGWR